MYEGEGQELMTKSHTLLKVTKDKVVESYDLTCPEEKRHIKDVYEYELNMCIDWSIS